jgi:HSP20 family protein
MTMEKIKVAPGVISYVSDDYTVLTVVIEVPGVKKEDINLRILDDSLHLSAPREDVEYVATLSFPWPVKPAKAEASYENGLLKVVVPFKDPMDDALRLEIK